MAGWTSVRTVPVAPGCAASRPPSPSRRTSPSTSPPGGPVPTSGGLPLLHPRPPAQKGSPAAPSSTASAPASRSPRSPSAAVTAARPRPPGRRAAGHAADPRNALVRDPGAGLRRARPAAGRAEARVLGTRKSHLSRPGRPSGGGSHRRLRGRQRAAARGPASCPSWLPANPARPVASRDSSPAGSSSRVDALANGGGFHRR